MIYRTHCLCLLVILPAVCVASLTTSGNPHSSAIHLRRKIHLKRSKEHGTYRVKRSHDLTRHGYHVWRYSSPNVHASKFAEPMGMGGGDSGVGSPRKKEDEQIENGPVNSGAMPPLSEQSDGSGSPSAASSLGIVFASTNTPPSSATNMESTSAISSSTQAQSQSQGQPTQSQRASSTLAAASGSSSSSSSAFSPALLAFILVPVCVFLLGMIFALYRIYGKPGNRLPPASPMILGDATTLGSGYHRDEAISLDDPTAQSRNSILGYDDNQRGNIKWEPRVERNLSKSSTSIPRKSIRDPHASHYLMPPFHTHGAGTNNSTPSRVLRPHVSRPYNRPHLAFTTDPESVLPLIVNGNKYRSYNNGQDGYTTPNSKGKGKENSHHEKNHNARKHRDDISTTPLNTSPRSLPFRDPLIPDVFSDVDIRFQARIQRSHSSLVNMTKDEKQVNIPSQSSANTSFDIGLAMLTEFSSPNVGLGLDLSPCSPSLQYNPRRKIDENLNGSRGRTSQDSAMPYLEHSVTAGSKGLAYLSDSSRETILPDNGLPADPNDELDIASALAVYKTQQSSDRLKAQKVPVTRMSETERRGNERDSPASSPSTDARYTPSDIKAPTLPTLSEMALSRADPLYESVTNELFSTYGMRMSTANGGGQKSRVSARISRMLSWFAGADSNNTGSRMSGVENRMSCEDPKLSAGHMERMSNISSPGGVQPLRIGKARKDAA